MLASAGLDPAELQQQWLDDYSQLTLPLAQLVAKVHRTRVSKAVGTLRVQPADLMARINFLAYEVCLTVNDLKHMLQRHLKFVSFHLESARDLLSWLQAQQVSNKQLQLASRAYPTFWSVDVARLQRSKQHLQQQLSITDSQWAEGLALQPWALTATTEVVDGVVAWLEAEPLGFGRTELAQLWQSSPQLFATPAATQRRNLQGLLDRCPLDKQQLRAFMRGSCALLTNGYETVLAKLDSLLGELPGLAPGLPKLLVNGGSLLGLSWESNFRQAGVLPELR